MNIVKLKFILTNVHDMVSTKLLLGREQMGKVPMT